MWLQRANSSPLPTRGSHTGREVWTQELYYYNFPSGHRYFSNVRVAFPGFVYVTSEAVWDNWENYFCFLTEKRSTRGSYRGSSTGLSFYLPSRVQHSWPKFPWSKPGKKLPAHLATCPLTCLPAWNSTFPGGTFLLLHHLQLPSTLQVEPTVSKQS